MIVTRAASGEATLSQPATRHCPAAAAELALLTPALRVRPSFPAATPCAVLCTVLQSSSVWGMAHRLSAPAKWRHLVLPPLLVAAPGGLNGCCCAVPRRVICFQAVYRHGQQLCSVLLQHLQGQSMLVACCTRCAVYMDCASMLGKPMQLHGCKSPGHFAGI